MSGMTYFESLSERHHSYSIPMYPEDEQLRLKEALQDWYAELETLVLEASTNFHARNEQECTDSANAADQDYAWEELHVCAQAEVAKQKEGDAYQ
jgi:hypothetical protein